ncbi:olfactory receptor 1E16-like [Hyperolius riggenbachi]|uniref:olfactory receptor 1E16-like n=1 Tax=Hyperolius riggenbachi TaxID=752182 RepID=UPI0035A32C6B
MKEDECPNSTEKVFHILAFAYSGTGLWFFFTGILVIYLLTFLGNMTIITLVSLVPHLQTPMYYFLANLAFTDVASVSSILPKLLTILQTQDNQMSLAACLTQIYIFSMTITYGTLVLASMSYDRFVAICKPLQYYTLMRKEICISVSAFSLVICKINAAVNVIIVFTLSFCLTQNIDHFYCDPKTLYGITSSNGETMTLVLVVQDQLFGSVTFLLVVTSYVFIILTISKIQSSKGRLKAFSSCGSHLTTVMLFYCPGIVLYTKPESKHSKEMDKLMSLIFMAVVPMLNPFVYTLRNKDIFKAVQHITRT